jgi:hypothetical protein
MRDPVRLIVWAIVDLFRSLATIEAEILTLRQQIIVLQNRPRLQRANIRGRHFDARMSWSDSRLP